VHAPEFLKKHSKIKVMIEKLLGYPRYSQGLEILERCYTNMAYKEEYKDYYLFIYLRFISGYYQ